MTGRLVLLDVTPELAGHVAAAINAHRKKLRTLGIAPPSGLVDLEDTCALTARSGQERPAFDGWADALHDHHVTPRLIDYDAAAIMLGTSARTVRRLVAEGRLNAVRDGRRVRIRPEDIDDYLARLARAQEGAGA